MVAQTRATLFQYDQTTHVKVVVCNFFLGLKMSFGNLQINLKIKKLWAILCLPKKKSQNEENVAVKNFKSAENQMSWWKAVNKRKS